MKAWWADARRDFPNFGVGETPFDGQAESSVLHSLPGNTNKMPRSLGLLQDHCVSLGLNS